MRLDHLLSKEEEVEVALLLICYKFRWKNEVFPNDFGTKSFISGGDALRGHTRSHPEHDG